MNFLERYQPRRLSEVLGQDSVVKRLMDWLAMPESCAMTFSGDTGIGKTVTAKCLATELGVRVDDGELGGYYTVPSGKLTGDTVDDMMQKMRMVPFTGSGWRVLACNEADTMSVAARHRWLDKLESIPSRCLIVFTTNNISDLEKRFIGRTEVFHFESRTEALRPHILALCKKIWADQVPGVKEPFGPNIGMPTLSGPDAMHASFRSALTALAKYVREQKRIQELVAVG